MQHKWAHEISHQELSMAKVHRCMTRVVGGSSCLGCIVQQCVWSEVFSYMGQFSMPVKAGASGICQWKTCLQPDLVQAGDGS